MSDPIYSQLSVGENLLYIVIFFPGGGDCYMYIAILLYSHTVLEKLKKDLRGLFKSIFLGKVDVLNWEAVGGRDKTSVGLCKYPYGDTACRLSKRYRCALHTFFNHAISNHVTILAIAFRTSNNLIYLR